MVVLVLVVCCTFCPLCVDVNFGGGNLLSFPKVYTGVCVTVEVSPVKDTHHFKFITL